MKALIFYVVLASIIVSLFFRMNPGILEAIGNKINPPKKIVNVISEPDFKNLQKEIEQTPSEKEKQKSYTFEDREKRGDYFYGLGYFDIASNEYKVASEEKETAEILEKLGDAYIKARKYEEAEKIFTKIYEKSPSDKISLKMVRTKIKQMNFSSAYSILEQIKSENDEKNYLKFVLDILNLDTEKTKSDLEILLKNTKDINTKTKLNEVKKAFDEFDVYRDGKDEHLKLLISRALTKSFEFEISQKIILSVLKNRPEYRDAWILSGYNNLRIGNMELALDELKSAYSIDPVKPEIQFYLGFIYEQVGDMSSSLDFYQKAYKNGHSEKAYLLEKIGKISQKISNFDLALEAYKGSIELDKNNFSPFENSIKILIEDKKDYKTALSIAEIGIVNNPKNPVFYGLIGWAYFVNGDIENSLKSIKKSIELSGEEKIQRNYLIIGQIEETSGNKQSAKENYEKAFNIDRNSDVGNEALKKYNEIKE